MRSKPELASSNINFIFGRLRVDLLSTLHPSAVQSFQLWQVFTSNVHPLTKVLHGPSVREELLRSLAEPSPIDSPTEALIISIYLIAAVSLTDDECHNLLGETRKKHLARYCHATEAALSRANFLRSTDLKVLQAFTLYLLSLHHLCDQDILWLLTGLATRMGQRMGLHRESSLRDLPPFEAELRRRVWWQIVILDGRAAQLKGATLGPENRLYGDASPPVGINDGDLVPPMSSLPRSSSYVPTEVVFCAATTPENKIKLLRSIDELEGHLEERYLRHINADIPLNLLTTHLARSAVCQLRLSVYHPIRNPEEAASGLSLEQLDLLLENSLEVARYYIVARANGSLQRYAWHVSSSFPFESFVVLVGTLSQRPASPLADAAWPGAGTSRAIRASGLKPSMGPPFIRNLLRRRPALCRGSQSEQKATTAMNCTGHTTPQGLQKISHLPEYDGCGLGASQNRSPQGDSSTVDAAGDEISSIIDDMDMDWSFWKKLLDGNAQAAEIHRKPTLSLPS
ncbi:fungal specific transcription factor domain-containing protein [Colletotrichum graminicola]|nr:fungal specific transcription factor domain-containing protein [Colletotrichum graminicola]